MPDTGAPPRAAVVLVHLGTPDAPTPKAVRRYLAEFLSDPRVIETSPLVWRPILHGVVLRTRPRRSAAAYAKVWDEARGGSPLRFLAERQAKALATRLAGDGVRVRLAMRYGGPSIPDVLEELSDEGVERVLLAPLYPQYAASSTATANDKAFEALRGMRHQPAIRTLPPYPDDPAYIDALATSVREHVASLETEPEVLLASFHGLPVTAIERGDPYAAHCRRTFDALRAALRLSERRCRFTYQSQFGRAAWLRPLLVEITDELLSEGVRHLAIITPGFALDCLETLEEIGIALRGQFLDGGGETFSVVPCLGDAPWGMDMLEHLVRRELAGWI